MSRWVHVIGAIDVDTYLEIDSIQEVIDEVIKRAPKITGSEMDCEVFAKVRDGYNTSAYDSMACSICPYQDTIEIIDKERNVFTCESPAEYPCPTKDEKYQTKVVITLIGELRDRTLDITAQEINNFIEYLEQQKFDIDNISICANDGCKKGEVIRW